VVLAAREVRGDVLRCLLAHVVRCTPRAPSRVVPEAREVLADVLASAAPEEHVLALAHVLASAGLVLLDPAACCLDPAARVLRLAVPREDRRSVAAATSATRRARKAR
jgi:hypothetical protein